MRFKTLFVLCVCLMVSLCVFAPMANAQRCNSGGCSSNSGSDQQAQNQQILNEQIRQIQELQGQIDALSSTLQTIRADRAIVRDTVPRSQTVADRSESSEIVQIGKADNLARFQPIQFIQPVQQPRATTVQVPTTRVQVVAPQPRQNVGWRRR
jgi:TolA-binding protein